MRSSLVLLILLLSGCAKRTLTDVYIGPDGTHYEYSVDLFGETRLRYF